MRARPSIGSEVYIKGYATLPFEVIAHNIHKGAKPVCLVHPLSGAQMWFYLRELSPKEASRR